jgi:phage-related protein
MTEDLKIKITAETAAARKEIENAKKEIKTFQDQVKKASEDVDKKFATMGRKIGDAMKTGCQVAAGAIASITAGLATLTKASIGNYAEYEQLVGGVETLFKTSAGEVQKYAENAYKTAGMSSNEYMATVTGFSASLLQSLGGDTAAAAKVADMALTDMSDNANKMGTSMESIQFAYSGFAKQNYTMLDNLKLGYGGTKEEMERLLADAEKFSGVKYDISSLNDVYQAIHVIQQEMGITGTTAQEASATISGSIGMTKAAWENLMTGLANGNADIPKLVQDVISSASAVLQNIIPAVKEVIANIPVAISEISPEAGAAFQTIIDAITQILPVLQDALGTAFDLIVDTINFVKENTGAITAAAVAIGIVAVAIGAYNIVQAIKAAMAVAEVTTVWGLVAAYTAQAAAMVVAIAPYVLIVAAIAAVIAIIVLCVKHWDEIKAKVKEVWDSMKEKISNAMETIKGKIKSGFETVKTNIINPIKNALSSVKDTFSKIVSTIGEKIENAKNKVKSVIDTIKGFFNFKVSWPNIPTPKFSISPAGWSVGDLLKGKIPKLSIKWNALGGVFTKPTLTTYGASIQGLGEDGAEAIVPLEKNTQWLDKIADKLAARQSNTPIVLNVDGKTFAKTTISTVNELTKQTGSLGLKLY